MGGLTRRRFLQAIAAAGAYCVIEKIPVDVSLCDEKKVKPELSNQKPVFHAEASIDKQTRDFLLPNIEKLINNLYKGERLPSSEISGVVAHTTCNAVADKNNPTPIVFNGQALILPLAHNYYFFVTAYHNLRACATKTAFYLGAGTPLITQDTLVYSKEDNMDVAFGWCFGSDIKIRQINFCNACKQDDSVEIVPSSSSLKVRRKLLTGKIVELNDSLLLAEAAVENGYSGSPVVHNGSVVGITTARLGTQPQVFGMAATAKTVEQMLRFYLDSCRKN